jgi:hypothetical protein
VPFPCSVDRHYKHMFSLLAHTLFLQTLLFQFAAATTCMICLLLFPMFLCIHQNGCRGLAGLFIPSFSFGSGLNTPGLLCWCWFCSYAIVRCMYHLLCPRHGNDEMRTRRKAQVWFVLLVVLLQFVSGEEGFLLVNIHSISIDVRLLPSRPFCK